MRQTKKERLHSLTCNDKTNQVECWFSPSPLGFCFQSFSAVQIHFEENMAASLVGGALLSATLQVVFDRLASREVVDYLRGKRLSDELINNLKTVLSAVNAVLDDAEEKQITNPNVKQWVDELEDASLDADDLLDEIATDALQSEEVGSGTSNTRNLSAVAELLEISERFGWDNNDKVGWSRVNFELLGTSKGGRIPRLCKDGDKKEMGKEMGRKVEVFPKGGEKRRERRERLRVRREVGKEGKLGIVENDGGVVRNSGIGEEKEEVRYKRDNEDDKDGMVENWKNPFPGREALLKKVLNRKRYLCVQMKKKTWSQHCWWSFSVCYISGAL